MNVTGTSAGTKNNKTGAITANECQSGGTASASINVIAVPTISKSFGASSIQLNGSTTLSFTISNPSANPVALTGIGFTDNLPSGLVVSTPNGLSGSCDSGTITATAGSGSITLTGASLNAGSSCTFSVKVTGTTAGTKNNTTLPITSTQTGAGGTASATLSVVTSAPDLTITKTHSGNFTQGQTGAQYTITVKNSGNQSTSGTVKVTDTLPTGLTATSISGTGWSCTAPGGPCTRSDALTAGSSYSAITLKDGRWDYRATIVFKNATAANEPFDEDALKKQLFPDQETFTKEEQRRFEILDAHWDVPVKAVDLEGK